MARENLWLVKCVDRDGDDVDDLRKEHMAGHLAHIERIVDHIAMAGPLKDPRGSTLLAACWYTAPTISSRPRPGWRVTRMRVAASGRRLSGLAWCWRPGLWPVG